MNVYANRHLHTGDGNVNWSTFFWGNLLYLYFIPMYTLTFYIILLGTYPIDILTQVCTDIRTRSFTVALFIIVKNWKQFKCPQKGTYDNGLLSSL